MFHIFLYQKYTELGKTYVQNISSMRELLQLKIFFMKKLLFTELCTKKSISFLISFQPFYLNLKDIKIETYFKYQISILMIFIEEIIIFTKKSLHMSTRVNLHTFTLYN